MKRVSTALALLAGSWLFVSGYYHHPDAWGWLTWALLLAGAAALLGDARLRAPAPLEAGLAALLLIPIILLLPWPGRAGPLLLAAGLAGAIARQPRPLWRWARSGATAAGLALLAQQGALSLYEAFTARSHELPGPLAALLGAVARGLGIDAAVTSNAVVLDSMRLTNQMAPSWELLLDPATAAFLAGGIALLAWRAPAGSPGAWRRTFLRGLAGLAGAVLLWLPVRSALLMSGYLHRLLRTDYEAPLNLMNMFWNASVHLLLLAGPMLLAWKLVPAPAPATDESKPHAATLWRHWRHWCWPLAAALAGGFFTAALLMAPTGQRNGGRVLVDEYHSDWEWTEAPMDTHWYGHLSGYNYACLYDYLSRFYTMDRRLNDPLAPTTAPSRPTRKGPPYPWAPAGGPGAATRPAGTLARKLDAKNYDVLILKVPTFPYAPEEVDAIDRFVRDGGGLILIGEHTDVFGSGTYLNQVARRAGFSFRFDCLFDVDRIFDQTWRPALVKHPVVAGMKEFEFAVSCSIDPGTSTGRPVIRSTGLKSLPAFYHVSNFYPSVEDRPDMRYGAFIQCWAARHGSGRVLAWADSTVFSNFAAFEPGKADLMLGMIEWANRRNGPAFSWLWLLGAAVLAGGLAASHRHRRGRALTLAAICLGWAGAVLAARAVNDSAMPLPTPLPDTARPLVRVAVDRTVCNGPLSKSGFIEGKANGFGIFERWILRVGYFTNRTTGVPGPEYNLVVLPFPTQPVSDDFRDGLARYVAAGGHLLVIDGPENAGENTRSTANSVLWPFRLSVGQTGFRGDLAPAQPPTAPPASAPARAPASAPASAPAPTPAQALAALLAAAPPIPAATAYEVTGGTPLILADSKPVAATIRYGRGSVTAVGFGGTFTDANMGATGDVEPSDSLKRVFELEYALLRLLAQGHAGN